MMRGADASKRGRCSVRPNGFPCEERAVVSAFHERRVAEVDDRVLGENVGCGCTLFEGLKF